MNVPRDFERKLRKTMKYDEIKNPVVTVTHGMRGWFAVTMWWNPDMGGFWEPWETAENSWPTAEQAAVDGRLWAKNEGLEFQEIESGSGK